MNLKTNKRKFLARVMLLVLLVAGALNLTACQWKDGKDTTIKYQTNAYISFRSHEELMDFVEKYNSQNDGTLFTFVSFDFDEKLQIEEYIRQFSTIAYFERNEETGDTKRMDLYDKGHSQAFGFGCRFVFYINEFDVQITCGYGTSDDHNFYQEDEMLINFVGDYYLDDLFSYFKEVGYLYCGNPEGCRYDFGELRSVDRETLDLENYYNNMYVYKININGIDEITVKINSEGELSQETLDEICQLLMDNIVIIN